MIDSSHTVYFMYSNISIDFKHFLKRLFMLHDITENLLFHLL